MEKNKRLLIAEKDEIVAGLIGIIAKEQGYISDFVQRGEDALSVLKIEKYDFLLLENRLYGMNGIDVAKTLIEQGISTQIIGFGPDFMFQYNIEAQNLGIDRFLQKPFKIAELNYILNYTNN